MGGSSSISVVYSPRKQIAVSCAHGACCDLQSIYPDLSKQVVYSFIRWPTVCIQMHIRFPERWVMVPSSEFGQDTY